MAFRVFQMHLHKSAYVQNFESKLVIFFLIVHQSEAIFLKPSEKMHVEYFLFQLRSASLLGFCSPHGGVCKPQG